MPAKKKRARIDPIPEHFPSAEAAGEFWDTHDLADYWDQTREVKDFDCRIERRQFLFAIEPSLVSKLRKVARQRGVSSEALLNLWLSERLNRLGKEPNSKGKANARKR